jgi:hypothetical protein
MNTFQAGQRVLVSTAYQWAGGAAGTVMERAPRTVSALRGLVTFVWVRFDSPQLDPDGDGPYAEAEIDASFLHTA